VFWSSRRGRSIAVRPFAASYSSWEIDRGRLRANSPAAAAAATRAQGRMEMIASSIRLL